MSKKMLIDATHAEETRVVVVDGNKVEEFDFKSVNKRQLAGNIYLAKVTRVEPSLQAAFVDYGGNRHGFLAFAEIHPDYYQIPIEDRRALLEEEEAAHLSAEEEEDKPRNERGRSRRRSGRKPAEAATDGAPSQSDAVASEAVEIDLTQDAPDDGAPVDVIENRSDRADEADSDAEPVADDVEHLGEAEVSEEVAPRRTRQRRYKIQEVIKVRQILLIQVVKEERGNKGAALTTYLSLAGRYCVLMPNTARGGGISRKITSAADRKKLKEIAGEIEVPRGAGLIIRTAGSNRTKTEIKRDYEYLLRQWEQIRDLTLKSIAPAAIYEEGSLIKRSIRDLYSREIDEVLVDGERGYREAKDYMKMLMPSHSKNVKLYNEPLPLFSRFQVESYLAAMFNPTVQLKSGGYIVIGVTEALVAIDVNSGRATRESSIEDTATKTNLEAAEEIARQLRLRDLAGLIVIDFIDMEDRRNNASVEKRLKDKLKMDRARIQIGRISSFGLLEMSRQRLRPGMLEATTQPCPHCHGTGHTRSDDSLALSILREIEEEGVRKRSKEVLVKVPYPVANYILNHKREHVAMIEARFGLSVRVESDPHLISPEYSIEKFKTAIRIIPEPVEGAAVRVNSLAMPEEDIEIEDEDIIDEEEEAEAAPSQPRSDNRSGDRRPSEARDGETGDGKKRKRRRRRRGGSGRSRDENGQATDIEAVSGEEPIAAEPQQQPGEPAPAAEKPAPATKSRSRSRSRTSTHPDAVAAKADQAEIAPEPVPVVESSIVVDLPQANAETKPAAKPASRSRKKAVATPEPVAVIAVPAEAEPEAEAVPAAKPASRSRKKPAPEAQVEPLPAPMAEIEAENESAGPKKRGWWSRAIGN